MPAKAILPTSDAAAAAGAASLPRPSEFEVPSATKAVTVHSNTAATTASRVRRGMDREVPVAPITLNLTDREGRYSRQSPRRGCARTDPGYPSRG
ncbi:hypothetical protein GCM10009753_03150 [Streptantibioticus ferralitis]